MVGMVGEKRTKIPPGALLALGFGTSVAMWAIAYVCRFPSVSAPGSLTLGFLLLTLAGGGLLSARLTGGGAGAGAATGLIASLVNLLILGSILGGSEPNQLRSSAAGWLVGSIAAGLLIGAAGGAAGRRAGAPAPRNWTGAFAVVAVAATTLLLVAGGIVTGARAGLAVIDWPNSFGYNMFLYPLARMSGGIYYEHAHRLLGTLVGLTTLVLALYLARVEKRGWVKLLALGALLLVVVQGLLGGMRVTGRPTLSTSPADTAPNITLAIVHGVTGQVFFAVMVALAVFLSTTWTLRQAPAVKRAAGTDRMLASLLSVLLLVQIVLGAIQRHLAGGLHMHIGLAVVVLGIGVASGARAWGLYPDVPRICRVGRSLVILLLVQMALGVGALLAVGLSPESGPPSAVDVTVTTIHQVVGAGLLAHAVILLLWLRRLAVPKEKAAELGASGRSK
jgi:cytochrome c oxidase assembly protein subunit 15